MRITDVFKVQEHTFSFEFFPPKDNVDALALGATIGELRHLKPSFISVTYGAGGSTQRTTFDVCRYIQDRLEIPAMAHYTCVGADAAQLREGLEYLKSIRVKNVMLLRGDAPKGETWKTVAGGFSHADELVAQARAMGDFCIGVAGYPEKHGEAVSAEADLAHLKRKVDAGGDFIVTQLFFENQHYFNFVKRARAAGIAARILPGIMPITNFKQIRRMAELSGAEIPKVLLDRLTPIQDDPVAVYKAGVSWAIQQCIELLSGGAPGIHFYTLNKSKATMDIYRVVAG